VISGFEDNKAKSIQQKRKIRKLEGHFALKEGGIMRGKEGSRDFRGLSTTQTVLCRKGGAVV